MTKTFARALRIGLVVVMLAGFFTAAQPVQAGTAFIINTTEDQNGGGPEQCALREAIIASNTNQAFGGCPAGSGGTDTIYLPAGEYRINIGGINEDAGRTGDLDILGSLSIFGASEASTVVHGNGLDRVFDIRFANGVSISNMTITGGSAVEGGAVLVNQSTVDLFNVHIDRNQASSHAGAFAISAGSIVSVYNSEITTNTAARSSAILSAGVLTLTNALIYDNRNTYSDSSGVITITTASTSTNRIENSTIANNNASSASLTAGLWVGSTARVLIRNSTVVDNIGTGLDVRPGGIVNMSHTIVARQQSTAKDCSIGSGGYKSLGYNLDSDNTCKLTAGGDKPNVADGALGMAASPQSNGGKTRTYALNPSSPAVDAGSPTTDLGNAAACHPIDQRYYFRPGDGMPGGPVACDIGAFELEGTQPTNYTYVPVIIR